MAALALLAGLTAMHESGRVGRVIGTRWLVGNQFNVGRALGLFLFASIAMLVVASLAWPAARVRAALRPLAQTQALAWCAVFVASAAIDGAQAEILGDSYAYGDTFEFYETLATYVLGLTGVCAWFAWGLRRWQEDAAAGSLAIETLREVGWA